ncbi:hypothetical protein [Actinacidiphila yeochonensis]|uniref:hypothetical protein n=1 Tax=Actinacidiphila yeochonensis TaxID=89050 RepID=UPI0005697479|nr:hypothetical protein [Actinacidiphila yeochonensis]
MFTDLLCAALTAAGLAIAFATAYRRRFRAAVRTAAVALLPLGLALSGLVTLGRRVGTAAADWGADLILKPTVWTGFAILACSALLFGAGRLFAGRGGRAARQEAEAAAPRAAAVPGGSAPALGSGREPAVSRRRGSGSGSGARSGGTSEFAEIEEILKRRGI